MNEKFNAAADTDDPRTPPCVRAADLVAYLYGEAGEREAKGFEQHLGGCRACREELSAFGVVRGAVGAWRREALGVAPSVALGAALADGAVSAGGGRRLSAPARKRTAAAALREFFTLSPMWLRAGALAATLSVCALAGLTLARAEIRWDENGVAFRTGAAAGERVVTRTVEVSAPDTFTRAQVDEMIKGEVARARAEALEEVAASEGAQPVIIRAGDRSAGPAPNAKPRRAAGPKNGATARSRDQLAGPVEEDLTSLYDLLRVVN